MAEAVQVNAAEGGNQLGNWMNQAKLDMERKALSPVFPDDFCLHAYLTIKRGTQMSQAVSPQDGGFTTGSQPWRSAGCS